MMQTVLITGGTGLVGKQLSGELIQAGFNVIILTRSKKTASEGLSFALWDIKKNYIDEDALSQADYIIHLAGAGVMDKRWTNNYKTEIIESRIRSSELLINKLSSIKHKVKAIISASAIGWYGPDKGGTAFTEGSEASTDFLGNTCRLWEDSVTAAESLGIRTVKIRTGIVLSEEGGALSSLIQPVRYGIAGIPGNGKQINSWIHIEDLCRIYIFAMTHENIKGSYNAVAPAPVALKEIILTAAEIKKGKFFITAYAPSIVLKALLGERSIEILKSCTVSCEKIKSAGFRFLFPTHKTALEQLLKPIN